jgi:hypothetical protein
LVVESSHTKSTESQILRIYAKNDFGPITFQWKDHIAVHPPGKPHKIKLRSEKRKNKNPNFKRHFPLLRSKQTKKKKEKRLKYISVRHRDHN